MWFVRVAGVILFIETLVLMRGISRLHGCIGGVDDKTCSENQENTGHHLNQPKVKIVGNTHLNRSEALKKGRYGSEFLPTAAKPLSDEEIIAQNIFFNETFTNMHTFQKPFYLTEPDVTKMDDAIFVIFVQSSLGNIGKRKRIRTTWAKESFYGTREFSRPYVFFTCAREIGNDSRHINEEIAREVTSYKDILLLDIMDSYDNLTFKGLLTMRWIQERTGQYVRYVIKTDDDVMINTFRFMSLVESPMLSKTQKFVVGFVWKSPIVKRKGRYAVSLAEYADDYYPAFCTGSGYIMPLDALTTILTMTSRVQFLKRDDPFITGILASVGHVARYSVDRNAYLLYDVDFERHQPWNKTLVVHDPVDSLWHDIWQTYVTYSKPELRSKIHTQLTFITSGKLSNEAMAKIAKERMENKGAEHERMIQST